jgi:hypothetical protein
MGTRGNPYDSRGFLELHGNVHQADMLRPAFTESREVLSYQCNPHNRSIASHTFVKMSAE